MLYFILLVLWLLVSAGVFFYAGKWRTPKGNWLGRSYALLIAVGSLAWLLASVILVIGPQGMLPLSLLIQPVILLLVHGMAALRPKSAWLTAALSLMICNLAGTAVMMILIGQTPSVGHLAGFLIGFVLVAVTWTKAFHAAGQVSQSPAI